MKKDKYEIKIVVRISSQTNRSLEELTRLKGKTKSEIVREAINVYFMYNAIED